MCKVILIHVLIVISAVFSVSNSFAQENKDAGPSQIGAFVGNMLPNGVPGVQEITPLWGLRYSYPFGSGVFGEGGGIFGHSQGVTWRSAFASLRMDIPLETLTAFAIIGLDMTRYESTTQHAVNKGGGHAGGGLMSKIGGNISARFDMKLNSKPGTSLYFALGLVYEFGGEKVQ